MNFTEIDNLSKISCFNKKKRKDQLNRYEHYHQDLIILIQALHEQYKTYGYLRVGSQSLKKKEASI